VKTETVLLNFRVPRSLHTAVKVAAARAGMSMSTVIRQLLLQWLAGRVQLEKPKEPSS